MNKDDSHQSDSAPSDDELRLNAFIDNAEFELGLSGDGSIFVDTEALGDPLLPGCGDLQVAQIHRIGHREEFPMAKEWETLIAMLAPGQELLWIVQKEKGKLACHLALKDLRAPRSRPEDIREVRQEFRALLDHFTKRAFPESLAVELLESETVDLFNRMLSNSLREVVVTSGQPSPTDIEDSRDFPEPRQKPTPDGMLNDIVEPFASEEDFSIVFTLGRVSNSEVTSGIAQMADLRTAISPLLKVQEGQTESKTVSKTSIEQTGRGSNTGQNTSRNFITSLWQRAFGADADEVLKTYRTHKDDTNFEIVPNLSVQRSEGSPGNPFHKCLKRAATSHQLSTTHSQSESKGATIQGGSSQNVTRTNAMLEIVDQKLLENIRSFKRASGTGGYHIGAEVFSPRTDLSLRIARAIVGSLSGAKTYLRPFQTAVYRGAGFASHLTRRCDLGSSYGAITLQSRHIAALFLPLPESDLPGLRTKRNVFYGKPNPTDESETTGEAKVWLGDLAHLKSGFDGRVQGNSASRSPASAFKIPAADVASHILIAGTTGSGKTQRAAAILNQLPSERFQIVVIESAKKTYRSLLNRSGVKRRILTLGGHGKSALRLNPFFFEPGTSMKRHVSILSDALADLLPVEALVGPKIREAIQNCYESYGWDIQTSQFRGDGDPVYPTMADLHMETMAVAAALNYGPELNSNYKGALLGRTRLFIDSLYQDIFGWGGDMPLETLLGDCDVIIEMDSLPPSEASVPSFVMSVLLERMRSRQEKLRQNNQSKDLLIVIEEAHNLLDRRFETERPRSEMGSGGFLLKQIVRLLQEGREIGMGMMVVDQSPASLADAVIRNTNTKIILRISDSEEAEKIGATLGLTKEESRDLHDLEDGESVIKVKNAGKALKLAPGRMVDRMNLKSPSPESEEGVDYFLAAAKTKEIFNLLSHSPTLENSNDVLIAIKALLACGGANPLARDYLARKLMATVAERSDAVAQCKPSPIDDPGLLLIRIRKLRTDSSLNVLSAQLVALLSRLPWTEAAEKFETDASASIPGCVEHLKLNAHWLLLAAADRFGELLLKLQPSQINGELKEADYSLLAQLIHFSDSDDRFNSVKSLAIQLN